MANDYEQPKERWHLDKRVQISHITATCAAILAAVLYLGDIKQDVEILKVQAAAQIIIDAKQDNAFSKAIDSLNDNLGKMNDKLDRLIERDRTK